VGYFDQADDRSFFISSECQRAIGCLSFDLCFAPDFWHWEPLLVNVSLMAAALSNMLHPSLRKSSTNRSRCFEIARRPILHIEVLGKYLEREPLWHTA
jgi:hypothetical protein